MWIQDMLIFHIHSIRCWYDLFFFSERRRRRRHSRRHLHCHRGKSHRFCFHFSLLDEIQIRLQLSAIYRSDNIETFIFFAFSFQLFPEYFFNSFLFWTISVDHGSSTLTPPLRTFISEIATRLTFHTNIFALKNNDFYACSFVCVFISKLCENEKLKLLSIVSLP